MPFDFGDIVLVPFPFTNQAASKRRPAVIVSNLTYSAVRFDVVLMAVTSQLRVDRDLLEIPISHWQAAGLLKPSTIKPIFATLELVLVLRRLGALDRDDQTALRSGIARIIG
jgi:mRNA interferase MazF